MDAFNKQANLDREIASKKYGPKALDSELAERTWANTLNDGHWLGLSEYCESLAVRKLSLTLRAYMHFPLLVVRGANCPLSRRVVGPALSAGCRL